MDRISNVLAERYASAPMKALWSQEGRVRLERDFWIAVMKGQRDLGLDVPDEAIEAYERVKDQVDTESIRQREQRTRHDVKARIEEFCDLAGHQHLHKGMTSRDLTENVEQLQVYRSLQIIAGKTAAVVAAFGARAKEFRDLLYTARTHNVAAQPTTLGKRFAMWGEEVCYALECLEQLLERYPVRGLKGAVGTQVDMLTLFDGDHEKVAELERKILKYLDIWSSLKYVGQVYPRSVDLDVVSLMVQVAAGPTNFAKTLRLMAGHELASEGFAKGQVGSSAMPHKMNARSSERICGFKVLLEGYCAMAGGLSGDQWNEGDVSCSVVRRVMLPDAFFAIDGLLETVLTVLNQMQVYRPMVERENQRYFPFLASTTILMEAVKKGAGREDAHEAIKEHAVAVAEELRQGKIAENDLLERLAKDERLGLSEEQLNALFADPARITGNAGVQVDRFMDEVDGVLQRYPETANYKPGAIL